MKCGMSVPLAERIHTTFLKSVGKKKKKKLRTTDLTDLNSQSGNTTSSWRTVGETLNFLDVPPPFD